MINYDFHDLSKHTDEELERQITEGFIFGEYDSRDHDMFLISRDAPSPDEKEIIETVPYMQGVYDFSRLSGGERFFDNREITYQVMLFENEYEMRKFPEQEIKDSLMTLGIQNLYDTHDRAYHWVGKCKSVTVEDDAEKGTLSATIVFDCYPFAYSNDAAGSDIWDDVYFPHWFFQETNFRVENKKKETINLVNIGSKSVNSVIDVTGGVIITGDFGRLVLKQGHYQDTQLVLAIGNNKLTLEGNPRGNVKFTFFIEEMI